MSRPTILIRAKEIKWAFRWTSDVERKLRSEVARLCVLYEDLRIEDIGAVLEELPALDAAGRDWRRFYFVRRTLATLSEIRGAMNVLEQNSLFRKEKARFPDDQRALWDEAYAFFEGPGRDFLKAWRNDFGGHFKSAAAAFAIADIHETDVGACEISSQPKSAGNARLPFVWDLVAVALMKDKPADQSDLQFFDESFTRLREAHRHGYLAIQVVIAQFVWPRFSGR